MRSATSAMGCWCSAWPGLPASALSAAARRRPPASSERQRWSERLGNKLFLPALIIPVTALLGTLLYNYTPMGGAGWIEAKRETYVFLGLGVLFALAAIFAWLRPPAIAPLQEGRRLIDAIGWAAVLPQMLAVAGRPVRRGRRWRRDRRDHAHRHSRRQRVPDRRGVRAGHGDLHHGHGQRLRRLPGDGRGDRRAAC